MPPSPAVMCMLGALARSHGLIAVPPPGTSYKVRMVTRSSITESGNGTTGWIYTSSDGNAYTCHAGGADHSMVGNGWLTAELTNAGSGFTLVSLANSSGNPDTDAVVSCGVYSDPGQSKYQPDGAGSVQAAGGNVLPINGDIIKLTRTGSSLLAQVARAGTPTTFIDLYTWSAFGTAERWPYLALGTTGHSVRNLVIGTGSGGGGGGGGTLAMPLMSKAVTLYAPTVSGGSGGSAWNAAPLSAARAILVGNSLIDEPMGNYLEELVPTVAGGLTWDFERHNVIGSPLRIKTIQNDVTSDAALISGSYSAWTGYKKGNNTDGAYDRNMLTEMVSHSQVSGGAYTHLLIMERNDQVPTAMDENTVRHLRHYHEEFRTRTGNSNTYFYNVWGDFGPASISNPTAWIAHERSGYHFGEAICSRINESLAQEGRADRITCLPVNYFLAELVHRATTGTLAGVTQGSVTATMNYIVQSDSQYVHLTDAGKYYIAMCVYSAVYKRTCVGLPASPGYGVPTTTARDSMQALAWEMVNGYYSAYPIGQQHNFTQRQAIATSHVDTYYQYRGVAPGSYTITDFQGYLTASNLSNPLYTGSLSAELDYWFKAAP